MIVLDSLWVSAADHNGFVDVEIWSLPEADAQQGLQFLAENLFGDLLFYCILSSAAADCLLLS